MSKKPVFGIIGAGAVGGYYGSLLSVNSYEVNFLVRGQSEKLNQEGLYLSAKHGEYFSDRVKFYQEPQELPPCDYLIIATKSTSNEEVLETLKKINLEKTTVLNFQNGLGFEEEIESEVPRVKVLSVLCFICSHKESINKVIHTDYGHLKIGNDDRYHDDVKLLKEVFSECSIPVSIEEDRRLARWIKLLWNIPYNGLCTLNKVDTSYYCTSKQKEEVKEIMLEVQAIARAEGYDITEETLDKTIEITLKMIPYKPSMLLDYENGRPLELKYMYENVIQVAKSLRVSTPKIFEILNYLKEIKI